jgi:aspartate/methionine/tyrosine aminotransferase
MSSSLSPTDSRGPRPVRGPSARVAAVQAPVIPIVAGWIRETPGTISLGQGVVSYGPPPEAVASLASFGGALADHRYGPVEGLPPLVRRLEAKLRDENDIDVTRGVRVVVTAGGNMAFINAILAIADPGDEIILPVPFYFNHDMAIVLAGCRTVPVATRPDYQLDLDALARAITPRTRAIVTVSPNNPSGAVYPEADLRAVNELCRVHGIYHVHDEAYEYFTYDEPHRSPGGLSGAEGHTISMFSLSKAFGFASWRIGYMTIPEALFDAVNKIQARPPSRSTRRWRRSRSGGRTATRTCACWRRCDSASTAGWPRSATSSRRRTRAAPSTSCCA